MTMTRAQYTTLDNMFSTKQIRASVEYIACNDQRVIKALIGKGYIVLDSSHEYYYLTMRGVIAMIELQTSEIDSNALVSIYRMDVLSDLGKMLSMAVHY
jgi:CTP:phosphocholine cytidylyltransferase-like protein